MLAGSLQVGDQCHMYINRVSTALLKPHLPYGLKERLALDVSDGSAYLGDNYVGIVFLSYIIYEAFYLVCHMGDYLDSPSQVLAVPLLGKHICKHLSGGQVGIFVKILIYEALIVA